MAAYIIRIAKEGEGLSTTEQTHQQDLERLKLFRYMDDDFMTACLEDNYEAVELILRIVLGQEDITIKSIRVQDSMKNLQGRSAILDVHAVDNTGKEFDCEIQRSDKGAGVKRARHNSSLLDAHILYVNGKYRGDDEVGKLMHDFSCTDPDDMNYEILAKKARYFKQDEKGVATMCKLMEDMRNEAELESARKTAKRFLKMGKLSREEIADGTGLPLEEVKALEEEIMHLV